MNITTRQATAADKAFLVEAVIEAEKSNSDVISYCRIFGLGEDEFRELLNTIFDEEVEGQELYIPNFRIAEVDGERAAALSTWIESESGIPSAQMKSNVLMFMLGSEKIMSAAESLSLMAAVNINRTPGALQVESVYTAPRFRGLGLISRLIADSIAAHKDRGAQFDKAEVLLMKNNSAAQKAYERSGFSAAAEKRCDDGRILALLPGDTRILMEKSITD